MRHPPLLVSLPWGFVSFHQQPGSLGHLSFLLDFEYLEAGSALFIYLVNYLLSMYQAVF